MGKNDKAQPPAAAQEKQDEGKIRILCSMISLRGGLTEKSHCCRWYWSLIYHCFTSNLCDRFHIIPMHRRGWSDAELRVKEAQKREEEAGQY